MAWVEVQGTRCPNKLQDKHVYTGCATVCGLAGRGVCLKQSEVRSTDVFMV